MDNLNYCIVEGNLTADPVRRTTSTGIDVANFSIAVNRKSGNKDDVSYLYIEAWGKLSGPIMQYLCKGSSVTVQGEIRQDRWEKDGKKESRIKISARSVRFNSNRKRDDGHGSDGEPPAEYYADGEGMPF